MEFEEQTIGQLYNARRQASRLLIMEGASVRDLNLVEALILQAASHVLRQEEIFTEPQMIAITELPRRIVNYSLEKFRTIDVIDIQQRQGGPGRRGKPLRHFGPTELGSQVLDFFQQPS